MIPWLFGAAVAAVALRGLASGLQVHRYSRGHLDGHLALFGRGLYFSRTPDGFWWRLRLRRRTCGSPTVDADDAPPGAGVREPRRPLGPGPVTSALELRPPSC